MCFSNWGLLLGFLFSFFSPLGPRSLMKSQDDWTTRTGHSIPLGHKLSRPLSATSPAIMLSQITALHDFLSTILRTSVAVMIHSESTGHVAVRDAEERHRLLIPMAVFGPQLLLRIPMAPLLP
ncbi:hypothetical protein VTO42DRAFT_6832 [Malbranchea cinnamomea]